jgi:hypothetical protein
MEMVADAEFFAGTPATMGVQTDFRFGKEEAVTA